MLWIRCNQFKRGCNCVHDNDLKDYFEPKDPKDKSIVERLIEEKENLEIQNMKLRDKVRNLKERLTKI